MSVRPMPILLTISIRRRSFGENGSYLIRHFPSQLRHGPSRKPALLKLDALEATKLLAKLDGLPSDRFQAPKGHRRGHTAAALTTNTGLVLNGLKER